ncbi:nitrilase-related carbon-nitrogen hydrolase [Lachnospiraceae bacterium 46-15]
MRIALCQTDIVWESKEENLRNAEKWLQKAKEWGAGLSCFPEMSFTGFSMNTEKTAEAGEETVSAIQELAGKYGMSIGFGWVEKAEKKAKNHYTVVDASGSVLGDYVKIHPFSYSGEERHFEEGYELSSFSLGSFRIGVLLCYDLRFPEPFQALAEKCDMILVAANWPGIRRNHWKCLLQARAIECQAYVAGVNCCGVQQGIVYRGDSVVFAPDGRRIAGFLQKEGILPADIQKDMAVYRKQFPVRRDRRWELYRKWYSEI